MAVPETCGDRKSGAVESLNAARYLDGCPAADRSDLAVADEDNTVADWVLRRTDIDRAAEQSQLPA